jgi:hypothetical protein
MSIVAPWKQVFPPVQVKPLLESWDESQTVALSPEASSTGYKYEVGFSGKETKLAV